MLLTTQSVEKVWGCDVLPAPFAAPEGKRIGEIWFEPPTQMPELLVKYLFASEKLSVQCHPDDDQAEAAGQGRKGHRAKTGAGAAQEFPARARVIVSITIHRVRTLMEV